jgi:MFS family permease
METAVENQRGATAPFSAEELKPIARRNSLLLAIALMFVWAGRQLLPTFGGMIAVQLTGARGLSGAMFAVYMLTGSTGAWQAGRWMDRAGRRPALATAFVIAAVGALVVGGAVVGRSFAFALLGSAVMGYGLGAGQLARIAAADMYPVRQRAKAVSYVLMGAAVGAILGPVVTAALEKLAKADGISPIAGPWFVFPVAFLFGVVAVVLVRPDPRTIAIWVTQLASETPEVIKAPLPRTRHELLGMRPVWVAIVAIAALETTNGDDHGDRPLGHGGSGLLLAPHLHAYRGPLLWDVRSLDSDWLGSRPARAKARAGHRLPDLGIRLPHDQSGFRRVARGQWLLLRWFRLELDLSHRDDHPG